MSHTLLKTVQVLFVGIQFSTNPRVPSFELYTLLEPIPGHPPHSTVSLRTIREAGYSPIAQREEHPFDPRRPL